MIIRSITNPGEAVYERTYDEAAFLTGNRVFLSDNAASDKADPRYKLIVLDEAVRDIFDYIHWVKKDIHVEQGGILLGKNFTDPRSGIYFTVIEKAIGAPQSIGTPCHLNITPDGWSGMYRQKREYEAAVGHETAICGWFHTHPNNLSCFMSAVDRKTCEEIGCSNSYSLVLNPQRGLMKAFRGQECLPAQAYFVMKKRSHTDV